MTRQATKMEIRMTKEEKEIIILKAKSYGFNSVSEFMRVIAIKGELNIK